MSEQGKLVATMALKLNPTAENFINAVGEYAMECSSTEECAKWIFNKVLQIDNFKKHFPKEDDPIEKNNVPFWYCSKKNKIFEPGVFVPEELVIDANKGIKNYKYNLKEELSQKVLDLNTEIERYMGRRKAFRWNRH